MLTSDGVDQHLQDVWMLQILWRCHLTREVCSTTILERTGSVGILKVQFFHAVNGSTLQENSYLSCFTFLQTSVSESGRKEQSVESTVGIGWDDEVKPYADVRINIFNKVISCLVQTFILLRNELKVLRKLDILWSDKSSGMSSFLIISINQFQLFYPYCTLANQVYGPLVCCS